MTEKSPDAFRTISEVADWLGVPTHVLRFWESRFTQVKPVKRAGGRRYYRPADMELLGGIRKLLHEDGLTIRGVQKILREEGVRHVSALSPSIDSPVMRDVTPSNVVDMSERRTSKEPDLFDGAEDAEEAAPPAEAETATSDKAEADEAETTTPPTEDAAPDTDPALAEDPAPTDEAEPQDDSPPAEVATSPEPEDPAEAEATTSPEPVDPAEAETAEPESPATAEDEDLSLSPEGMEFLSHDTALPDEPDDSPTADELDDLAALDSAPPEEAATEPLIGTDEPEPSQEAEATTEPEPPLADPVFDLDHIPDDPPEEDDAPAGRPLSLAMRAVRMDGQPDTLDREALGEIAARLKDLRARMGSVA